MFDLSPTEDAIRRTARHLAETVFATRAAGIDRDERYPSENVETLREAGLLGMTIPRALGGRGATLMAAVVAISEIARHCAVTARIVVETNMGALGAVLAYGTEAQRRMVAGMVLAGDKPAICISEPGAGSAATQMTTTARRVAGGHVL
ncbi:MAG: acyl-CoA dehydrogenase family protein, partial [Thermohalobaculum sp.]|nr:acyl-CoA dehydrogenase family protein [Thermohalobaculum sp.]